MCSKFYIFFRSVAPNTYIAVFLAYNPTNPINVLIKEGLFCLGLYLTMTSPEINVRRSRLGQYDTRQYVGRNDKHYLNDIFVLSYSTSKKFDVQYLQICFCFITIRPTIKLVICSVTLCHKSSNAHTFTYHVDIRILWCTLLHFCNNKPPHVSAWHKMLM